MKLTKAQRHVYYKLALQEYELRPSYLCGVLRYVMKEYVHLDDVAELFPELKKRKPTKTANGGHLKVWTTWWPRYIGYRERPKVLRACIRETAPKKRKK